MKTKKSDHQTNSRTYQLHYVLSYFYIPIAIWPLFYTKFITFTQLGIILSISFIAQAVLELPSGALADMIGRKKTIIISTVTRFIGMTFIVIANGFWMILVGEVLDKVGEAFYSGSGTALIYDSLKENGKESTFQDIESKGYFKATVGFVIASTLGGILFSIHPRLPFFGYLIVLSLAIVNSFFFQEPKLDSEKASFDKYIKQNLEGFKHIFRHRRVALISLYSLVISFVFYAGLWVLYQKSGNEMGLPPQYVGLLISGMYVCRAVGTKIFPLLINKFSELNFGVFLAVFQGLSSFLLALTNVPIAILGLGSRYLSDGFRQPYLNKLQNDQIESKYRATSLSAVALITTAALAIFNPIIGMGIDSIGARSVTAITGLLSIFFALPLALALKKEAKGADNV